MELSAERLSQPGFLAMTINSLGRNRKQEPGGWNVEPMEENHLLVCSFLFNLLLILPRNTSSGVALATVSWALPCSTGLPVW